MEAFCIASGPSLTLADVELVRQWRTAGRRVYAVNNSVQLAPWADAMFAMDRAWWNAYRDIHEPFKGKKYGPNIGKYGVTHIPKPRFNSPGNSGAGAIALAILHGATTVYLLGYDCQHTDGKAHWHVDHPTEPVRMGNAASVARWPAQFAKLAKRATIINCTRVTALDCFPRATLETVTAERIAA